MPRMSLMLLATFFRRSLVAALVAAVLFLQGCDPVSLTLFGVGTSAGVSYALNGMVYKTFTAPLNQVQSATLDALKRMGIQVADIERNDNKRVIRAETADRQFVITLESISARSTRIKSITKQGPVLKDRATATEVIIQTEQSLMSS